MHYGGDWWQQMVRYRSYLPLDPCCTVSQTTWYLFEWLGCYKYPVAQLDYDTAWLGHVRHLSHWFAEQCCFTMDWVATKIPYHKRFAPHSDWATRSSWIRHNHNILSKDLIYKFVWFIIHGKLKVNHIHLMASEAISIQWSVRENCMHAHQHKQFESHMCTYGYLFQIYYWSGIQTLNNEEERYLEEETTQ